jgi:tRNA (guanine37-N1)-methyltransferase
MRFEILTIFPGFFAGIFENGILRRALAEELVTVGMHDLRAFTHDRHRTVDDRPFGGGEGMVLKPEPLAEALEALGIAPKADRAATIQRTVERPDSEGGGGFNPRIEPTQPAGILQAAEDFSRSQALYQGTTSPAAEKLNGSQALDQGTTSPAAEKLNGSQALYQGTTSPAAEKLNGSQALYQGTTSPAAEKLNGSQVLYQGTTSVVPESPQNERGALAPEGSLSENPPPLPRTRVILLSAQGRPFTQSLARELAGLERVVLICGRYEGVDERINELYCDLELSIGDYVLSGGELAAAVVMDATMRLVPGVLGNEASGEFESFGVADAEIATAEDGVPRSQHGSGGLLDYPHYTRPAEFGGLHVPEILLNGDHAQIRRWRREQQLRKTLANRPDLLEGAALSKEDCKLLDAIRSESH